MVVEQEEAFEDFVDVSEIEVRDLSGESIGESISRLVGSEEACVEIVEDAVGDHVVVFLLGDVQELISRR